MMPLEKTKGQNARGHLVYVYNWTDEHDQFIRDNWATMTIIELSAHLGISKYAVRIRAYEELGLESKIGHGVLKKIMQKKDLSELSESHKDAILKTKKYAGDCRVEDVFFERMMNLDRVCYSTDWQRPLANYGGTR